MHDGMARRFKREISPCPYLLAPSPHCGAWGLRGFVEKHGTLSVASAGHSTEHASPTSVITTTPADRRTSVMDH